MNISKLIRQKRKEKNMTMEELASLLGVNQSTITRWESGDIKSIKADKFSLLTKYLDIDESINFANFNNCNFKDYAVGQIINIGSTNKKINDIVDQLTDEGQEELLNYAEYLLRKYKK